MRLEVVPDSDNEGEEVSVEAKHLRDAADWVHRGRTNTLLPSDPLPVRNALFDIDEAWWRGNRLNGVCAVGMVAVLAYGKKAAMKGSGSTSSVCMRLAGVSLNDANTRVAHMVYQNLCDAARCFDTRQFERCEEKLRVSADLLDPPKIEEPKMIPAHQEKFAGITA